MSGTKDSKSGLRIGYAGSVQFVAQLSSLITGLLFVTLITRNLSVSDFGIWQLVGSATGIAILPTTVIAFWNLRDIARGESVGRTSIAAGLLTLPLTFVIFLAVATGVGSRVELIISVVVAGLLQLPFMVLFESVKGIVQASRPSLIGYSLIPFEIGKVAIAYYLVIVLKVGLYGAIVGLSFAYLIQDLTIIIGVRDKFKDKLDFGRIRRWLKTSWIPLLDRGVARIWSADGIIVAVVLGAAEPVGLYQGARVFTAIITYSEIFLRVLYPKLIRDRLGADVAVAFRLQTLLEIPMVVGVFVLAEDLLSVLGPSYVVAAPVLRILALVTLIESTEHVMYYILYGAEKADSQKDDLTFSKLKSSWLVKLPLLDLTKSLIYAGILSVALHLFASKSSPASAALLWGVVYSAVIIPYTILKAYLAGKFFPYTLPKREIIIYSLAGLVMGAVLLFQKTTIAPETSVIPALIRLGILVGLSALVYFTLVSVLDQNFRRIIRQLFRRNE